MTFSWIFLVLLPFEISIGIKLPPCSSSLMLAEDDVIPIDFPCRFRSARAVVIFCSEGRFVTTAHAASKSPVSEAAISPLTACSTVAAGRPPSHDSLSGFEQEDIAQAARATTTRPAVVSRVLLACMGAFPFGVPESGHPRSDLDPASEPIDIHALQACKRLIPRVCGVVGQVWDTVQFRGSHHRVVHDLGTLSFVLQDVSLDEAVHIG